MKLPGILIIVVLLGSILPEKAFAGPISIIFSQPEMAARTKKNSGRNYQNPVTKEEKGLIAYIVKTLAFDSILSIGRQKSKLKSAGDKINHIHPLLFLKTVFSDEELKAGIAAIAQRAKWIKNGFFDGIYGSLKAEAEGGNLFPFTGDFAQSLKISEKSILYYLEADQWKEFVDFLMNKIPRNNDPNRYNM